MIGVNLSLLDTLKLSDVVDKYLKTRETQLNLFKEKEKTGITENVREYAKDVVEILEKEIEGLKLIKERLEEAKENYFKDMEGEK